MSSKQKKAWDAVLYGNRWCFLTSSLNPTGKHTQWRRKYSAGCEQKSNFNSTPLILSAQLGKLMALDSWKQGPLPTHQHDRFGQHLSWRGIGATPNFKEFLDIQNWNTLCLWWLNFIQFQLHTWTIKLQHLISAAGSFCDNMNRNFHLPSTQGSSLSPVSYSKGTGIPHTWETQSVRSQRWYKYAFQSVRARTTRWLLTTHHCLLFWRLAPVALFLEPRLRKGILTKLAALTHETPTSDKGWCAWHLADLRWAHLEIVSIKARRKSALGCELWPCPPLGCSSQQRFLFNSPCQSPPASGTG